jgi:hypothetical protein
MASRAVFTSSGELLATGHGSHRIGHLPHPHKAHGWTNHLTRIIPVLSHFETTGHRPISAHSGELSVAGNGCAATTATVLASQPPPPFLSSNHGRPNLIQGPQAHRTPSRVFFLKSPLVFFFFRPRSSASLATSASLDGSFGGTGGNRCGIYGVASVCVRRGDAASAACVRRGGAASA